MHLFLPLQLDARSTGPAASSFQSLMEEDDEYEEDEEETERITVEADESLKVRARGAVVPA